MWFYEEGKVINEKLQYELLKRLVKESRERFNNQINRVLLLPPDITRYHSGAGKITNILYHLFKNDCEVDVIPTLGQHVAHTKNENEWMFGNVPEENIYKHDWRNSCKVLGKIDSSFVKIATGGKANWDIPVEVNRLVIDGNYDLIINIGQVVPHEVLGFANHNKNYFIGLGGKKMITASHMMAATCGIEDNLAQIITPLRGCYNIAEKKFLNNINDIYIMVVKTKSGSGNLETTGLYIGEDVKTYVKAARYARKNTVYMFDKPIKKVICYMSEREFKSTWVSNKAIYRTRKVIADGGNLIIIAPGVKRFGEQNDVDLLIRKYGYKGTPYVLEAYRKDEVLRDLSHAAAHMIHGSSEGRFEITYATDKLSKEDLEDVGYKHMNLDEAIDLYSPQKLKEGFNVINSEVIYFINSPSLGLWTSKDKYIKSLKNNLEFIDRMIEEQPKENIWGNIRAWNVEDINSYQ